jgi:hypothetical protein
LCRFAVFLIIPKNFCVSSIKAYPSLNKSRTIVILTKMPVIAWAFGYGTHILLAKKFALDALVNNSIKIM